MLKRILAIGGSAVALLLLGVWLIAVPWMATHPHRFALTTTPAALGMRFENVSFPAKGDGLTIRGWWMPAAQARAILIIVHGDNANRRDVYAHGLEISRFLVGQNISVLAPDLRNFGLSDGTPGNTITLGFDESKDVIGAIDYALKRAPGLPIYLMGESMGGATVIYAAAADPRVKRIVLLDPVLDPHPTALNLLHAMLPLPRWTLVPVRWSAETFFLGNVMRRSPLKVAETLKLPILLIQDDGDRVCDPTAAYALARRNSAITLWISHDPPVDPASFWVGFAGHAAAYRLHRAEMERQLSKFLATDSTPSR